MDSESPERVRQLLFETIENQIEANDPPETGETLKRLKKQGYSRKEAMKLIASVLSLEIFAVMEEGREFDNDKYVEDLKALPELPEEYQAP